MDLLTAPLVRGFLLYFMLYVLAYAALLLIAWRGNLYHAARIATSSMEGLTRGRGAVLPPVSLLVPLYNEEALVVDTAKSLLNSNYPTFEVVLINDGSDDGTLPRLRDAFDLVPTPRPPLIQVRCRPVRGVYVSRRDRRLLVVDKENGGRSDAINAGLNYARYHLVGTVDADSVLENDSLLRCARPFADPRTVASGGVVRIVNGCRVRDGRVEEVGLPTNPVAAMQVAEYARAFFVQRAATGEANALPIISGAFGLFRRDLLIRLGGFDTRTVAEDMEMVMRFHRYLGRTGEPYRIAFVPDPVAWTEGPETFADLAAQRARWHRGLGQVLWRYRDVMLHPRHGALGMLVLPFFWLFEFFEPVVLLLGYALALASVTTGAMEWSTLLGLLALNTGVNLIIGMLSLIYGESRFARYQRPADVARMVAYAVTEPFWYRWLTVVWRLRGMSQLLLGEVAWGKPARMARWVTGTGGR